MENNFNDEILKHKAFQLFNDFTTFESLKIAKNIIHLIYNDILYNAETKKDNKTKENILKIMFELDEIIKNNE